MPRMYDYKCSECDETKEYLVRNEETNPEECSNCGAPSDKLTRLVCHAGGGFYGLPMNSNYGHTDTWGSQSSK